MVPECYPLQGCGGGTVAVLPALRPGELRPELVQLPRIDGDPFGTRLPDRVAVPAADLDAERARGAVERP